MAERQDFDWLVIGSGFGGSVAALRLAEKGYSVGVLESGRRFADHDFASSAWQARRYFWMPRIGLRGIFRLTVFKDVFVVSGNGVGGGSLGYANTLYRACPAFFANEHWNGLADWDAELGPHYDTAERMLGVADYEGMTAADRLLREFGDHIGVGDTYKQTRVGVFFGTPGKEVEDPYFGGAGPRRTGCTRCAACMIGCRHGAKNTLVKNYLWFAERLGVQVIPERQVTEIAPIGAPDGSEGYRIVTEHPGAWIRRRRRTFTARGVVVAAGALGTNKLLAECRHRGALPRISDRLGHLVRTNSESIQAVTAPARSGQEFTDGVAITSSIYPDRDTHIEVVGYGRGGDAMSRLFTTMTGDGTRLTRPMKWIAAMLRHPLRTARLFWWPFGWSRRTIILLVMQSLDTAMRLRPRRRLLGGIRLQTEQDPERPNPTFIPAAEQAAKWFADRVGGVAQSGLTESAFNIPTTAHILGGAVIGASPAEGVVDARNRAFGYENLIVTDGSAVPANPGVNPSLTITALAERAMTFVPNAPDAEPRTAELPEAARSAEGDRPAV